MNAIFFFSKFQNAFEFVRREMISAGGCVRYGEGMIVKSCFVVLDVSWMGVLICDRAL